MKSYIKRGVKPGLLASCALLLLAGCTDDHYDIQSWGNGDKTLWENIEANPQLSDFAALLKRTTVMKDENDRTASLKASELLNQSQSFTMWAPQNGTFDAQHWNALLDQAAAKRTEGTEEARIAARHTEYLVWQQLVANHIARFNHDGQTGKREVRTLNNKRSEYNGSVFNGVQIQGEPIAASNGALHLLKGQAPFAYNIYDYLSAFEDVKSLNDYIKDPSIDHTTFSETASEPGAMNEEGKMVYIDSVYTHTNDLLSLTNATIRNEDSTYIALIPSNTAWEEAIAKVSKLYQYGRRYSYKWEDTGFSMNKTNDKQMKLDEKLTSSQRYTTLGDSLQQTNVRQEIVRNLFFAPWTFNDAQRATPEAMLQHVTHADSLISTTRTVFYNMAAKEEAPDGTLNPALAGIEPYRASNGYVYKLDHYNFDPSYSIVARGEVSALYEYSICTSSNTVVKEGSRITLTDDNYNRYQEKTGEDGLITTTGVQGEVDDNVYRRFEIASDRAKMYVDFRLPQVYSAGYTIKVVMVPTKINLTHIVEGEEEEVVSFDAEIVDDEDNISQKVSIRQADGQFDPNKVNTITLWENYEFSKCYVGLGSDKESFARLRLTIPFARPQKCRALNVVKVILEPYRGQ